MKLFTTDILVVDVETTGLDPNQHACIEIGAVLLDYACQFKGSFRALVPPLPGKLIDEEAMNIHGYSLEDCATGISPAEAITDFNSRYDVNPTPIIAGWNVSCDVAFLQEMYKHSNLQWPFGHRFLDIQSIHTFQIGRAESLREVIWKWYFREQTHRALDDALYEAAILKNLAFKY
jgi:DNA polymerase III subunit epsilon